MSGLFCMFIFLFGLFMGSIFNRLGNIFSNDKKYNYNICKICNHEIGFFHLSLFSYIKNLGRCEYCKHKISIFPSIIEISSASLFLISYLRFSQTDPVFLNLLFALSFISALLIIIVSDIEYMLIPDRVLIFFGLLIVIIKILIGYYNESYKTIIDVGYEIIFLFYDGFFMFLLMYGVKLLGDVLLKKDSMGGGDIKLMFFISMILGWKLSIIVVFLAAFLALPGAIVNMLKSNKLMLAFGPYLSVSALLLFLMKIDFNTILEYLV